MANLKIDRTTIWLAALALVLVGGVTPLPFVGMFIIAPLLALALGAWAGWRAIRAHREDPANRAALAGVLVGVGALIGSTVGLAAFAYLLGSDASIQDLVRMSEPQPEARIPVPWVAPMAAIGGALVGLFAGLVEMGISTIGGVFAALVYERQHPAPAP